MAIGCKKDNIPIFTLDEAATPDMVSRFREFSSQWNRLDLLLEINLTIRKMIGKNQINKYDEYGMHEYIVEMQSSE